jgi:hypothetical protein
MRWVCVFAPRTLSDPREVVVKIETGKNNLPLAFRSFSMSSGLRSPTSGCAAAVPVDVESPISVAAPLGGLFSF